MSGGTVKYVPLNPPKEGATKTSSAAEWSIDFEQLEKAITSKTLMMVSCVLSNLQMIIRRLMQYT